jgi:hypothetical protein
MEPNQNRISSAGLQKGLPRPDVKPAHLGSHQRELQGSSGPKVPDTLFSPGAFRLYSTMHADAEIEFTQGFTQQENCI